MTPPMADAPEPLAEGWTPGPWECYPCLDRAGERVTSLDICSPHEPAEPGAAVIASVWGNNANAHLIAAAPELYSALIEAVEALAMCEPRTAHGASCQTGAMLKARAALALARGEQS